MEKKIGIVAPHRFANYGTLLQAYALAHVIAGMGYDCEYISYSMSYKHSLVERIWNKLKRICGCTIESLPKYEEEDASFIHSADYQAYISKADSFYRQYIPHSKCVYNPRNVWKSNFAYDKFIVGSDQSWSVENFIYEHAFYFLPFVFRWKRKYAYAPSLGTTQLTDQHKKILLAYLPSFRMLSCREQSNCPQIVQLLKHDVNYVVDPTLLLSKEEWTTLACKVDELPEKYILAYILGEKNCISEFAEALSKERSIPVFYVLTRSQYATKPHCLRSLSPQQWIYAIANAECVVTDSFHGTLFSINYEREFYVFHKRENEDSIFNDNGRIIELLKSFDLTGRFVKDEVVKSGFIIDSSVEYKTVQEKIMNQRKQSMNYLYKILMD